MTSPRSPRAGKDYAPRPVPASENTKTENSDKTVNCTTARPWCKGAVIKLARPVPWHICIHGRPAKPGAISAKKYPDLVTLEAKMTGPYEKGLD